MCFPLGKATELKSQVTSIGEGGRGFSIIWGRKRLEEIIHNVEMLVQWWWILRLNFRLTWISP
jgi:hypothetical protein